ncbi:Flp pilus assembly protein CpaB [bacterium]|nr:Flp pilus assembly protein CpaB [bacterium]NCT19731.1 Flp pilus assembly protein CpaB [bacterium]OIO85207.1 MAG: Flp pilus assembly protein CpaB [Anaerolineae bacterium CG2_30_57_67]
MKKVIPIILAALVFVVALIMNMPEKTVNVVSAAHEIPANQVIVSADVLVKAMPASLAPEGAADDPAQIVGQPLRVSRAQGDPILLSMIGGQVIELASNERAIAIQVSAATGIAGMLMPGDHVGLTAVLTSGQAVYSKYITGGLRVLWVDPAFQQAQAPVQPTAEASGGMSFAAGDTSTGGTGGASGLKGLIVLAVPTNRQIISFDFSEENAGIESQPVYLIDLIPALSANGVSFGLMLEPKEPNFPQTSGLYIPNLMRTPGATLTPTPSPTPTLAPTPTWAFGG